MKKLLLTCVLTSVGFIGGILASQTTPSLKEKTPVPLQTANPISFFHAHRQGRGAVGLMWRTSGSGNVVNFQVECSYDGQYFRTIATLPGGGVRHTWKDNNAFPGYVYYRIVSTLIDGTTYYTDIEVVHIVQH